MKKDKILEVISGHFLNTDETNLNQISELVQKSMEKFSSGCGKYDAVLGDKVDMEWLQKYEEIPEEPRKDSSILYESLNALNGQIRWHSLAAMHNINPPIMMECIAGSAMVNLYNPNCLWDFVSAGGQQMEQQVVRQMAKLCGWDENAGGAFTFGGKACLINAIRIGLSRACKKYTSHGIKCQKKTPIVITSEESHYTVDYVCSLVGIGINNCKRVKTVNERMVIDDFKSTLYEALDNETPIAAIVVLGGNTINNSFDSVKEIYDIVQQAKEQYKLDYTPYIHFDSVVGWPWIFFKDYDFDENKLEISEEVLMKIKTMSEGISEVCYADSMGCDFHKMGFAPYQSSLFLIKDMKEFQSINKDCIEAIPQLEYGNNFMQHYTLEHSRSFAPIISSWLVLQTIGKSGFQAYISNLIENACLLRTELSKIGFEVLNPDSLGFASIFWVTDNEKLTLEKMLENECEDVERQNEYVYNLFHVLMDGCYSDNRYVFAYIPNYLKDRVTGKNISTIRIFPMSVNMKKSDVLEIVEDVAKIKQAFDEEVQNGTFQSKYKDRVLSVPK